jgi:hypothetical protein
MQLLTVAPDVLSFVVSLADEVPEEEDVKAGWVAFAIFIGLIVAVAFLGFSLVKHLRRAQAAEEAGLYDPSDKKPAPRPGSGDEPADNQP